MGRNKGPDGVRIISIIVQVQNSIMKNDYSNSIYKELNGMLKTARNSVSTSQEKNVFFLEKIDFS